MELVAANIGLPREAPWQGRSVTTAIGKQTVEGRVALCKLNLVGNRQGDLSVHGERIKPPSAIEVHVVTIGRGVTRPQLSCSSAQRHSRVSNAPSIWCRTGRESRSGCS